MKTTIEEYLENARKIAERERMKNETLTTLLLAKDKENESLVVDFGKRLLPEEVRDFVSFAYWSDSFYSTAEHHAASIWVMLPGCAPISVALKVDISDDFTVTSSNLNTQWGNHAYTVNRYEVSDGDDGYEAALRPWQQFAEFDQAVSLALTTGNNKDVVDSQAVQLNMARPEPVREPIRMCPLTVVVEGEQAPCMRGQCAWWVGDGCAVTHIGKWGQE